MFRNESLKSALLVGAAVYGSCIVATSVAAQTETWHLDPAHSSAQFSVRHMGISTVRGAFTKVSGDVRYSPADVSKSSIDVVIDANSVDTRVEMRDKDLRSDHFLDVAKYPTISFKSKHVVPGGTGKSQVTGDLTIHGVTREVVLDVDGLSGPMKDPRGNLHLGASASARINRSDFGMTGMMPMVGDEVTILIDVELVQRLGPGQGPGQAPPSGQGSSTRLRQ